MEERWKCGILHPEWWCSTSDKLSVLYTLVLNPFSALLCGVSSLCSLRVREANGKFYSFMCHLLFSLTPWMTIWSLLLNYCTKDTKDQRALLHIHCLVGWVRYLRGYWVFLNCTKYYLLQSVVDSTLSKDTYL